MFFFFFSLLLLLLLRSWGSRWLNKIYIQRVEFLEIFPCSTWLTNHIFYLNLIISPSSKTIQFFFFFFSFSLLMNNNCQTWAFLFFSSLLSYSFYLIFFYFRFVSFGAPDTHNLKYLHTYTNAVGYLWTTTTSTTTTSYLFKKLFLFLLFLFFVDIFVADGKILMS